MIESLAGAENIGAILEVPGIDMVLEGAADLSQSCGVPWETGNPEVQQALQRVQRACNDARVPYCSIPRSDGDYELWYDRGVRNFVLGDERGIAFRALLAKRQSLFSKQGSLHDAR